MSGSSGQRTYTFRIAAEGMQEFVQNLQRVTGGSQAANAAIQRLIQSSPQLASSLLSAQEAVANAAKRAEELRLATDRAADGARTSSERIAHASDSFGVLESKAQGARRALVTSPHRVGRAEFSGPTQPRLLLS